MKPTMDVSARRELQLLEAVEENSRVTQRGLATKLGIALGLTNIYLKRLMHKGYIKCVNVQSNRLTYLITPRGIAEKARLTYEFIDYSMRLYGEVRQHLRVALQDCAKVDRRARPGGLRPNDRRDPGQLGAAAPEPDSRWCTEGEAFPIAPPVWIEEEAGRWSGAGRTVVERKDFTAWL